MRAAGFNKVLTMTLRVSSFFFCHTHMKQTNKQKEKRNKVCLVEEEVIIQQLAEITSSAKHFIPTFKKKPCLVFHLQDSALPIKPMG